MTQILIEISNDIIIQACVFDCKFKMYLFQFCIKDFNQTSASGLSSPSNQTFDSSDTRPSVIGRSDPRQGGDGRDGNASNSDGSR